MWCKGRVKQLLDLFFCWICVPFFFLTHQTKVKHGLHGFSLSDAFTLSCLQCDWGHSNDWTLISSPSIWVYVGSLRSSWKRLQHTHTYMNTSCLHPANTHTHHCCSSTPQILPLLSTVLGFSFPSWFHFILFFLSRVCLYVEKLLEWPDDHVPRVQIHPTVRVHVFVLFASIWETNPVESKCFVCLQSS